MKSVGMMFVVSVMAISVQAQKTSEKDVPAEVKTAFATKYPAAKGVKWEKEDANFEAEFKLNKAEYSAEFDASGKFVQEEQEIKTSELPPAISAYIKANYAEAELEEATKITLADGLVQYEAEVEVEDKNQEKEMDLIFDASGNFLRKVEKSEKEDKD